MSYRVKPTAAVVLIVSALVPSLAWAAGSGGTGVGGSANTSSSSSATPDVVQPGDQAVSASGDGITVKTIESALLDKQLQFTGSVPASAAGQRIVIERNGRETGWTWEPTVSATAHSDGSFSATWTTDHIGRFAIRAVIEGAATAAAASPAMTVTVYRPSVATLYGPGFWGRKTACGQPLTHSMLGVANRTLKCGEKVAIYYHGRELIVPVIDRGPYANHADWDLTMATGKALGITGTATIGAVSLPAQPQQ